MEIAASLVAWLCVPMWGDRATRKLWLKIAFVFGVIWLLVENTK